MYACLGLAAAAQSLVVLCAPFVKALSFVDGKLYARRDSNFAAPNNARADGDPLVILRVGWLGSCIQDMTTHVSTCTLPTFPGAVCASMRCSADTERVAADFGLAEARGAAAILTTMSSNALSVRR